MGGYTERVAEKECIILFLRKCSDETKPFYTVEVRGQKAVQLRNPKFCKPFLERMLGIKISRIEYPKSQETIDISADAKSVRLDIYVEDGKETVYNIEM